MGYMLEYNMAMEKERMSRREFLVWGFDVVGAGAIALYLGPKLYPFAGLLKTPEEGSIKPADFEKLIVTKEQGIFLGEQGHKKVRLNTPAFAQALADVSNLMIPDGGAEKLYAVLERKPLIVEISPFDLDPDIVNGQRVETAGRYIKYMQDGPKIIFTPIFLKDYFGAQSTFYEALQKALDATVWHEIVHLIQDLKNPLENPLPLLSFNIKEAGYILGGGKEPDQRDLPDEVEARRIGDEIGDAKLEEYSKHLDSQQSWPFGRFFIFS